MNVSTLMFLAVSPPRGNRRVVTPLLGFSWGFSEDKEITLDPSASLTAADWESHLVYLRDCYPEWSFTEMSLSAGR